MVDLTQEKYWKLYQNLPKDLQDILLSEDTAEAIYNICKLCQIDQVKTVANYVGEVLLGLLPPKEFPSKLQKALNLDPATLQKLEIYISHYIFDPVRDELEKLYETSQEQKDALAHT